jgi:hypothetical protein
MPDQLLRITDARVIARHNYKATNRVHANLTSAA